MKNPFANNFGRKIAAGVIALSMGVGLAGPVAAEGVDPAVAEAQIDAWVENGEIRQKTVDRLERKVDRFIRKAERRAKRGKSDAKVVKLLSKRLRLSQDEVRDILSAPVADETTPVAGQNEDTTGGETPGTETPGEETETPGTETPGEETETPDAPEDEGPKVEDPVIGLVDLTDIPDDVRARFTLEVIEDKVEKIAARGEKGKGRR